MTDADLDRGYTALCHALADVGEARASLFLSMLCLAWMARATDADQVLPDIENIRRRLLEEGAGG